MGAGHDRVRARSAPVQLADGSRRTLRPGLPGPTSCAGVEAGAVGAQAAARGPATAAARPTRPPSPPPARRSAPPRPAGRRAAPPAGSRTGSRRRSSRGPRGRRCAGSRPNLPRYIRQIASFSRRPGQVEEEHGVEPLGPRELRRQPRDVVAGADEEGVGLVVVEPGQQRRRRAAPPTPESPTGRRTAPARRLLDLVDEDDAGGHRVDRPQRLADVALGLARRASPSGRRRRGRASAGPSRCPAPWRTRSCPCPATPSRSTPRARTPAGRPGRRARAQKALRASRPPRSANVSPPRCSVSRPDAFSACRP